MFRLALPLLLLASPALADDWLPYYARVCNAWGCRIAPTAPQRIQTPAEARAEADHEGCLDLSNTVGSVEAARWGCRWDSSMRRWHVIGGRR